jgi:hypothetical protein
VDIIFFKTLSKIKHIPILGYIILGEDGNFKVNVDIRGNFIEQSFETHTIKDTTTGLFNIIKRTISIPLLPFINNKETNTLKKEN